MRATENTKTLKLIFDIKAFFLLSAAFVLFTVIGTLSHEGGHIIVAKSLGYKTQLHYAFMTYDSDYKSFIMQQYFDNIKNADSVMPWEKNSPLATDIQKLQHDSFLITLGGPLQTMLTGLLGLLIILLRKKRTQKNGMHFIDWLAIFLSLFWLREIFNLATSVGAEILNPHGSYFGGDERLISLHLNLWEGVVPIGLAVLASAICLYVIFAIIPSSKRLTFIASGLVGGMAGFYLWLMKLGPIVMP